MLRVQVKMVSFLWLRLSITIPPLIYVLKLYGKSIGESVAVSLSQTVRHNSTLHELHVSNNCIGDEGVIALTESLRTPPLRY